MTKKTMPILVSVLVQVSAKIPSIMVAVGGLCVLLALVPAPWQGWLLQIGGIMVVIGGAISRLDT
jgi:hypothetical protein